MLIVFIAKIFGWFCALLPEWFARTLCAWGGDAIYFLSRKRRYIAISNLNHAFPQRTLDWHKKISREASRRLVEMALFALAAPYFKEERIIRYLRIPHETQRTFEKMEKENRGGVILIPHLTLCETLTALPLIYPRVKGFGAIFRPFNNARLNRWVKETRERWGIQLLSRKAGFSKALAIVREQGWVGILFDQNAGSRGAMITLFERVASASDLPGIICKKYGVPAVMMYTKRTAFWRGELYFEHLPCPPDPVQVTLASHAWLERYLSSSDDACTDWLWMHDRWKTHQKPSSRLNLHPKKNFLEVQNAFSGRSKTPRKTRFWLRLPNWLGDIVMALPLIRVLPRARPDAEITLLAQKRFIPFLEKLVVADQLVALPPRGGGYFSFFRKLKTHYADTFILFTNSFRGDLEAWLTATPQRFGMLRPGAMRPLLSDFWEMPADIDESREHQTRVWQKYWQRFGLCEELDLRPFPYRADPTVTANTIGLICGTENNPEKRWPISFWRRFIKSVLESDKETKFTLFGTASDEGITQKVAVGFAPDQVTDLAGKTNLLEFAAKLKACRLIVCNDTGGMHLANAVGVTVVAIFGPTNPVRTGPIFNAPKYILQPPQCPPRGGAPIDQVSVARVLAVIENEIK